VRPAGRLRDGTYALSACYKLINSEQLNQKHPVQSSIGRHGGPAEQTHRNLLTRSSLTSSPGKTCRSDQPGPTAISFPSLKSSDLVKGGKG
jgi:hypothetical protein